MDPRSPGLSDGRMRESVIPPMTYLAIAEEHGLLDDIDRWVISHAIAVIAERGVRHGQLNLVMVDVAQEHTHADGSRHTHLKPQR